MTSNSATDTAGVGLRERRRQMAKKALEQAAFELFAERGYDATTVDDIAAAAMVSRASFFRYFTGKDDVLGADDEQRREAFMAALRAQNADHGVLEVLRGAVGAHMSALDEDSRRRIVTYTRVMVGSRALLGHAYEIRIRWIRELAAELLPRLGAVPDADLVASMLAEMTLSILETALRATTTEPERDFTEVVERGFSLLRIP